MAAVVSTPSGMAAAGSSFDGPRACQLLAALAGFGTGEAISLWTGVFSLSPACVVREAMRAVSSQAGLDCSSISVEELHLGLRSLELEARGQGNGAAFLKLQVWRELFRAYLDGPGHAQTEKAEKQPFLRGPAASVAESFARGASGIAEDARGEPLQSLRSSPHGWEEFAASASALGRALRESLQSLKSRGPYKILGVGGNATDAELKRAYRELCLQHHPDKGGSKVAFQQVQEAFEQIMADRRRGIRPTSPSPPQKPPNHKAGPQSSRTDHSYDHNKAASDQGDEEEMHRQTSKPGYTPEWRCSPPQMPRNRSCHRPTRHTPGREASCERPAEGAATLDASAVAAMLDEVELLAQQVSDGAQRAQAAQEAVTAAAGIILSASLASHAGDNECSSVLLAAPSLLSGMRSVVEGTQAAAQATMKAASRLAAELVALSDGAAREELADVLARCSEEAQATCELAGACELLSGEVEELLFAVKQDLESGPSEEAHAVSMAIKLLASGSERGCEAGSLAVSASASIERDLQQAVRLANRLLVGSGSDRARSPAGTSNNAGAARDEPQQSEASSRSPPLRSGHPRGARSPHRSYPSRAQAPPRPPSVDRSSAATEGAGKATGMAEALVQRRLQRLKELAALNEEVQGVQREVREFLAKSPLLMPSVPEDERSGIISLCKQMLAEATYLPPSGADRSGVGEASLQQIAWLLDSAEAKVVISDPRLALLRLSAMLDTKAVICLLEEHLRPFVQDKLHFSEEHTAKLLEEAVEGLRRWVDARQHS